MDTPRVVGRMIFMPVPPSGRSLPRIRPQSPETLRRQRVAAITEQAVANANARCERVKQLLSLHDQAVCPVQPTPMPLIKPSRSDENDKLGETKLAQRNIKLAQTEIIQRDQEQLKLYPLVIFSAERKLVTHVLVMSVATALNSLFHHVTSQRSNRALVAIDAEGPSLLRSLGLVNRNAVLPAHAANVLEIYLILSSVVQRTFMRPSSLLDVLMLLDRAVRAGHAFSPTKLRRLVIAALSMAQKRSKTRLVEGIAFFAVDAADSSSFARSCFPSLTLRRLETTEFKLSQTLGHKMRFLGDAKLRAKYVAGLEVLAIHHQQVFQNYLHTIKDIRGRRFSGSQRQA